MTKVVITCYLDEIFATEEQIKELSDSQIIECLKEDTVYILEHATFEVKHD